jgi:hypothetical protein
MFDIYNDLAVNGENALMLQIKSSQVRLGQGTKSCQEFSSEIYMSF